MPALLFRNVDVSPDDPVEVWPIEAIATALDRGSLTHWRRLAAAIRIDPWGPVARDVEQALTTVEPYGVAAGMRHAIAQARSDRETHERALVAAELKEILRASGYSTAEFASRLGTSRSRLSTYLSGRVTPSAAMMIRAREVPVRA